MRWIVLMLLVGGLAIQASESAAQDVSPQELFAPAATDEQIVAASLAMSILANRSAMTSLGRRAERLGTMRALAGWIGYPIAFVFGSFGAGGVLIGDPVASIAFLSLSALSLGLTIWGQVAIAQEEFRYRRIIDRIKYSEIDQTYIEQRTGRKAAAALRESAKLSFEVGMRGAGVALLARVVY